MATAESPSPLGAALMYTLPAPIARALKGTSSSTPPATPPSPSGTPSPKQCTSPQDCVGACPPDTKGCTCAATPSGQLCIPTCVVDQDCPVLPGMTLVCSPEKTCAPPQ